MTRTLVNISNITRRKVRLQHNDVHFTVLLCEYFYGKKTDHIINWD